MDDNPVHKFMEDFRCQFGQVCVLLHSVKEAFHIHAFLFFLPKLILNDIRLGLQGTLFVLMQEHTDAYVDYVYEQLEIVKQNCKDPIVLIEQHVDFSEYVPGGFGTADCVIVSNNMLHIIDFKYGIGVLVDAYGKERNNDPRHQEQIHGRSHRQPKETQGGGLRPRLHRP